MGGRLWQRMAGWVSPGTIPPCLAVSQEFRLADQGRQGRCSQPSVSCHTRSLQKTKYASHTLYRPDTRQIHASAFSSVCLCCMWSLTPPPPPSLVSAPGTGRGGPRGNDVVLNLISLLFLLSWQSQANTGEWKWRNKNTTTWIREGKKMEKEFRGSYIIKQLRKLIRQLW